MLFLFMDTFFSIIQVYDIMRPKITHKTFQHYLIVVQTMTVF